MPHAIHLLNTPKSDAREAYIEAWKTIDERGLRHPDGRRLHVCWLDRDVLNVVDIWDSLEQQQAFMGELKPILDDLRVSLDGPPRVGELLHIVRPPE